MKPNEILGRSLRQSYCQRKTQAIEYDLVGNPMPAQKRKEEERVYSLNTCCGLYIFASFFRAYGIDSIEEKTKIALEKKFTALLNGLPS